MNGEEDWGELAFEARALRTRLPNREEKTTVLQSTSK